MEQSFAKFACFGIHSFAYSCFSPDLSWHNLCSQLSLTPMCSHHSDGIDFFLWALHGHFGPEVRQCTPSLGIRFAKDLLHSSGAFHTFGKCACAQQTPQLAFAEYSQNETTCPTYFLFLVPEDMPFHPSHAASQAFVRICSLAATSHMRTRSFEASEP